MEGQLVISKQSPGSVEDSAEPNEDCTDTAVHEELPGEEGRNSLEQLESDNSPFVDDLVFCDGLDMDDRHDKEGQ